VLAMISSPEGYPPLDVDAEWGRLRQAVEGLAQRELVILERI
jgi:hypothetical protein